MKVRVGISACLLGRPVRYDGRDKFDPLLAETLAARIEWIPVCPETEFGLPVPREPIQLEDDPARPELRGVHSGCSLSCAMRAFCRRRVDELGEFDLAGFVFKAKSPSCGLHVAVFPRRRDGRPRRRTLRRGLVGTSSGTSRRRGRDSARSRRA